MKRSRFFFVLFVFCACCTGSLRAFAEEYPFELTVSPDGSGDSKSINEALNRFRAYSPVPLKLHIRNGVYKEKVVIPHWLTNLTIDGQSIDSTILTNDDYSGKVLPGGTDPKTGKDKFGTFNSYTVLVQGNDIVILNLTIRNTAGRVGQGVALHVEGDRFIISNCRLLGNQDTLLTANDSSRQYYINTYIEGTTDFIFGPATVLFQNCEIRSLSNSYVTAASTSQAQPYGYVFKDCRLTANEEADKVYLGRPWRQYARTVFIHCELGAHIRAEGWHNWSKTENEKTAFYAESDCTGPGADRSGRVPWSHALSRKEAKRYNRDSIFGDWRPKI
jgi:pectinesterase